MTDILSSHDMSPEDVAKQANLILAESSNQRVEDSRKLFQDTLNKWVLASTCENKNNESIDSSSQSKIVDLWLTFVEFEVELRQFKQATRVLESAVSCPIAGLSVKVWSRYADFCTERKKLLNARKVYLRGLSTIGMNNINELWKSYFIFVRKNLDPDISCEELRENTLELTSREDLKTAEDLNSLFSVEGLEMEISSQKDTMGTTTIPSYTSDKPPKVIKENEEKIVDSEESKLVKANIETNQINDDSKPVKLEYFSTIPIKLPLIEKCPRLLFHSLADAEKMDIDQSIIEELSNILKNETVFKIVRSIHQKQLDKEKTTLHRWQDLVALQMKEGCELYLDLKKHSVSEHELVKHREVIEYQKRCQLSQKTFITMTEKERLASLREQQIALRELGIPNMTETVDIDEIKLQRAIASIIVEADELENGEHKVKEARRKSSVRDRERKRPRERDNIRGRDRVRDRDRGNDRDRVRDRDGGGRDFKRSRSNRETPRSIGPRASDLSRRQSENLRPSRGDPRRPPTSHPSDYNRSRPIQEQSYSRTSHTDHRGRGIDPRDYPRNNHPYVSPAYGHPSSRGGVGFPDNRASNWTSSGSVPQHIPGYNPDPYAMSAAIDTQQASLRYQQSNDYNDRRYLQPSSSMPSIPTYQQHHAAAYQLDPSHGAYDELNRRRREEQQTVGYAQYPPSRQSRGPVGYTMPPQYEPSQGLDRNVEYYPTYMGQELSRNEPQYQNGGYGTRDPRTEQNRGRSRMY